MLFFLTPFKDRQCRRLWSEQIFLLSDPSHGSTGLNHLLLLSDWQVFRAGLLPAVHIKRLQFLATCLDRIARAWWGWMETEQQFSCLTKQFLIGRGFGLLSNINILWQAAFQGDYGWCHRPAEFILYLRAHRSELVLSISISLATSMQSVSWLASSEM